MESYKNRLKDDFSNAAERYGTCAGFQRQVAERLANLIAHHEITSALDLGAGTGFMTSAFHKQGDKPYIIQLDIAHAMCQKAAEHGHVINADMEQLPIKPDSFAVIISSLAFQWSREFERLWGECHRVLKDGGLLAFSILGEDTLHELRNVLGEGRAYTFPEQKLIVRQLEAQGFEQVQVSAEMHTRAYPSYRKLLEDIRDVGASYKERPRHAGLGGVGRFKEEAERYQSRYSSGNKVLATWDVLYFTARKAA